MSFDLDEIDIFTMADEGFSFNIMKRDGTMSDAKIVVAGIFGKKGKDCRTKYEAKERELLVKYSLTGKSMDDLRNKIANKEPVDETLIVALQKYEEALEDAYIKFVLVPLTKSVEGIKIGGEEFICNDKNLFELYKKYPTVLKQAMEEIYNVENLSKN